MAGIIGTYSNDTYQETTPRDRWERRKSALKLERASFMPHWVELSQFISPRRGRYFIDDRNRGGDRYTAIINSKATAAKRVATSGLQAGCMSPQQRWFQYETPTDLELMNFGPVQVWLYQVEQLLMAIFASSNAYSMSSTMFGELLQFATGAMVHVDDFADVARFYTLTAGSYLVGQDDRQVVNTLIREWEMTTIQIMKKWGPKSNSWRLGGRISQQIQTAYDTGNYDTWWPVTHIIEPNYIFDPTSKLSKNKLFSSTHYEPGNPDKDAFLSQAGFDYFPAYVPRWDVTGEDIYGTDCPAIIALGDIKGLQIEERRKAQAIDKLVSPPMQGPAALRNVPIDSLPNGMTIYDDNAKDGLKPLYQVNPQIAELRMDMKAVEDRIDNAFFVNLFRAISDMQGIQPRNELELHQRDAERLLELGPVLDHINGEFLHFLVDNTFGQCVAAGLLPPAPQELQGMHIKPKFIGALNVAQQAVAAGNIERNATFVAGLTTGGFQQAAAKLDPFAMVDEYARVTGLPPKLIVPTSVVKAQMAAQQKVADNQRAMAATEQMVNTAKAGSEAVQNASASPMGGDTVLKAISQAVQRRGNTNLFAQPKSLG